MAKLKIGLDAGGVLVSGGSHGGGRKIHFVPGAEDVLKELTAAGHNLYLISYAYDATAKETAALLAPYFTADRMYFVRAWHDKAEVGRALGLTDMIEDRSDGVKPFAGTGIRTWKLSTSESSNAKALAYGARLIADVAEITGYMTAMACGADGTAEASA